MRIILTTCFLLIIMIINSDAQAQFETTFYFEDAAGNRDTIIIGADPTANELVNSHLGEVLLTAPWDNEFEVRVATEDNLHNHLWFQDPLYIYNKKITYFFDLDDCGYSTSVIFLFYTTHFPITVTWDTAVWSIHDSECYLDGSFFHHSDAILEPGWWTSYDWHYACLGLLTSYQFDTTHNDPYVGIMDSVMNVGTRFIYGLQLATNRLENPISPCQFVVGIDDPKTDEHSPFIVYPNPVNDFINIDKQIVMNDLADISIINSQGIEVLNTRRLNDFPIYLGSLSEGVYFIRISYAQLGFIAIQRFVIVH